MIVRIPCLGGDGGFGNNLFRYVYAKAMAGAWDALLEAPTWIGDKIFNINDPAYCPVDPFDNTIELDGFFQDEIFVNFWRVSKPMTLLGGFRDLILEKYNKSPVRACAHLRRGDYCEPFSPFSVIPKEAYLEQLEKLRIPIEDVTWIENKEVRPFVMDDLYDFFTMMNCRLLLRANSSFSWWASELGGPKTYSPSFDASGNIVWTEGNPPLDLMLKQNHELAR